MAGQGATSLQRIGSHRRWNQSLYATEMHLSLAWASLLWFHGVWYGLSLFCFHSQLLFLRLKRPKTGFFQKAPCLWADILCIHAHLGTYVHAASWACVLVFPCIGHGSSTTVQLGLFSVCSITTISVSTLRAYTYQSECRADGPHSSGPSDVLLRLCSRFKLQYGHMSLTCTALMRVCRRAA